MNQRFDNQRFDNQRPDDNETRYFGSEPRQYFPGEHDPNYQYQQPQYQQDYPEETGRASGGWALVLGILLGLALLAAGLLFFLWRSASEAANQPPPEPVTQTVVTTPPAVTETVTERPGLSLPTSNLPTAVPDSADIESWVNDLLGGGEPTPPPAQ